MSTVRALAECLGRGSVLAAAPRPRFELTGCSWPVRAFYDIRRRLPSLDEGIGGSGVYALSATGRSRFDEFPKLVADDTFVRIHFKTYERETLFQARSIVFAPRTLRGLIAIETRADFGSFELSRLYPELWKNKGDSNHWPLVRLFKHPSLWVRLFIYCCVRSIARQTAKMRLRTNIFQWQRDDTSRGRVR
jgi:hypothetical protein